MLETLHCLHGALRVRFRVLTVALQALVLSSLSTFWHFLHHSGLLSVPLTQSSLVLLGLHAGVYCWSVLSACRVLHSILCILQVLAYMTLSPKDGPTQFKVQILLLF